MAKITFVFRGEERSGEFDSSTSLLSAAAQLGVPIISTCGGQPSCTDCRVKVLEGLENLSRPEFDEVNLMGSVSFITKVRLSCQTKALGDVRCEPERLQGEYDRAAREEKHRKRQDRYLEEKGKSELDDRRERAVREARRILEERQQQSRGGTGQNRHGQQGRGGRNDQRGGRGPNRGGGHNPSGGNPSPRPGGPQAGPSGSRPNEMQGRSDGRPANPSGGDRSGGDRQGGHRRRR